MEVGLAKHELDGVPLPWLSHLHSSENEHTALRKYNKADEKKATTILHEAIKLKSKE